MVSLKLEMKVSLPSCYTRSWKDQANIGLRFFLIVPSYSYSCGLRALIEAVNWNNYIKKSPKYSFFIAKMITELKARDIKKNLKTVKNLAKPMTYELQSLITL